MPKNPESIGTGGGRFELCFDRPLGWEPEEQIGGLQQRVALLKTEARLLLERFERNEISSRDARAEADRLEREAVNIEREVEKQSDRHSPRTKP